MSMRVGTNGVVVNEYGQVLLIRRNDTRTMAPPGGSVESGELPDENVTREVREETGLIVMAVRLVGVYTWRSAPDDVITFVFRCIQRGGELAPSSESPQVGFFPTDPLPGPMIPFHRHRIRQALRHKGGAPIWEHYQASLALRFGNLILRRIVYGFLDVRNRVKGLPKYDTPPEWQIETYAIVTDEEGRTLWIKGASSGRWHLPGGSVRESEPPWQALERIVGEQLGLVISLETLSGVYVPEGGQTLSLAFAGRTINKRPSLAERVVEHAYYPQGDEPAGASLAQKDWVKDAAEPGTETVFRRQRNSRAGV
jgi:ADP-ribose pyrophosphatase YjhB (NUDIX family)